MGLLGILLGFSIAYAKIPKPVIDDASRIQVLCDEILAGKKLPRIVNYKGRPGLFVLASTKRQNEFLPHELSSTTKYAQLIDKNAGERLLLLAAVEGRNVPAFDGVIYDAKGVAIANYSVKTWRKSRYEHIPPATTLSAAIKTIETFAEIEPWLFTAHLILKPSEMTGNQRLNPKWFKDGEALNKDRFKELKHWLSSCFSVFGITRDVSKRRPTRIVMDFQEEGITLTNRQIQRLRERIRDSGGLVESITVLQENGVVFSITK